MKIYGVKRGCPVVIIRFKQGEKPEIIKTTHTTKDFSVLRDFVISDWISCQNSEVARKINMVIRQILSDFQNVKKAPESSVDAIQMANDGEKIVKKILQENKGIVVIDVYSMFTNHKEMKDCYIVLPNSYEFFYIVE